MTRILHGIIHGKTIELSQDPGIDDGEQVVVQLERAQSVRDWGDGIRNSAGSLADIPGLDEALDEIVRGRQNSTFREIET